MNVTGEQTDTVSGGAGTKLGERFRSMSFEELLLRDRELAKIRSGYPPRRSGAPGRSSLAGANELGLDRRVELSRSVR
jgi:hypothetical protein